MPRGAPLADAIDDPNLPGPTTVELEMLYRNEQHALVRFFTRYRASQDDARDLVQEAFLRLSRIDLRGGVIARPEAYLRQIARNLLRDRAKAAHRHAEAMHIPFDDTSVSDVDELRRLEARDSLNRLQAVMGRMKPKTREIFMAHRVHGLSYAEIAAETGLSIKGVEKQMGRAIAQINRLTDPD
jgi:RNA polymerase sigma-70 factor (ECF subfamily)